MAANDHSTSISDFFDALTAYAIDPTRWTDLLDQFDRLSDRLENWDPGELVAELSRAESLSWRIKDSADPARPGFAYLLLDEDERVVGGEENLPLLAEYLSLDESGTIRFSNEASSRSMKEARDNLSASSRGHSLIALAHPGRTRHRFGFLISRSEFPPGLLAIASTAELALFIAQDDGSQRLESAVQASFGLTAAELEVTMKLASGLTLKEAAEDLDISINTARNHLQSVFDKSGINRQSDLVLVVTQLSVILAGTDEAPEDRARAARRSQPRHFMILADGRRIAYRTYGDVRGAPVLYVHETLGCSSLPPETEEFSRELGLYLIAPERPGFGFSDVDADFTFDSVAADMIALLDHLHIERAQVLGFLSGSAFAIRMAERFPSRITHLMLVAGRPPAPMRGRFKHLMPLYTKMISQPWLMTSFFNILRNRASEETNARLIRSVYGSVPHDMALLESRPDIFQHMIAYTLESMTVTAAGISGELKCFARAERPELPPLGTPITAWHGTADNLASLEDLERCLKDQRVNWRLFPGAGSLILFEYWHGVLQALADA
jgi:pimeloyl-ACP methyl ester carboxylesterase/DNA-binding CsgD family transcriptional regulator